MNCKADKCTSNASICTECKDGFTTTNGSCHSCDIENCLACSNSSTCTSCSNGFQAVNGSCVVCTVQHCAQCNSSNVCAVCEDLYELVNSTSCSPFSCAVENCTK